MVSTRLLETCRGLKETYYIKEMCVKLVTYQKLYRDARSAKYKKYRIRVSPNHFPQPTGVTVCNLCYSYVYKMS